MIKYTNSGDPLKECERRNLPGRGNLPLVKFPEHSLLPRSQGDHTLWDPARRMRPARSPEFGEAGIFPEGPKDSPKESFGDSFGQNDDDLALRAKSCHFESGARELNPSFKLGKLALNRSTSPAKSFKNIINRPPTCKQGVKFQRNYMDV